MQIEILNLDFHLAADIAQPFHGMPGALEFLVARGILFEKANFVCLIRNCLDFQLNPYEFPESDLPFLIGKFFFLKSNMAAHKSKAWPC